MMVGSNDISVKKKNVPFQGRNVLVHFRGWQRSHDTNFQCVELLSDQKWHNELLVGGWTTHFKKYARQIGSFSQTEG